MIVTIGSDTSYCIGEAPPAGAVIVWVGTDEPRVAAHFNICLSPDNRTRAEREALCQRLIEECAAIAAAVGSTHVCFVGEVEVCVNFIALFYAGAKGVKLAPYWNLYVETISVIAGENGPIEVPKYINTNPSFRLILGRFK